MVDELSNIKMNKLEIGHKINKLMIPELTEIPSSFFISPFSILILRKSALKRLR